MSYTKLFSSIVTSTIWTEDDKTRIVWITMLAIANKHGEVQASIPGLARVAGVSVQDCHAAIEKFLSPDPYSRSSDDEGRRIEKIDGGWQLLNHAKYRAMASKDEEKTANAIRQARHRRKVARNATNGQSDVCAYCGMNADGVDHVIPKCKGGTDDNFNLVRSCNRCNQHKASRDVLEFLNDFTLPYKISKDSILSNPILSQIVTESNGKWFSVTQNRDIAEAEAEADTNQINTKRGFVDDLADSMPTETANSMNQLQSRINALHPSWKKRPHFSAKEFQTLHANAKAWADTTDEDWRLLTAYMAAKIPDEWRKDSRDYFQPDVRQAILTMGPTSILGNADKWLRECRKRNVDPGILNDQTVPTEGGEVKP